MPRAARLYYPGGVFHIISRCPEGRFLIKGDAERHEYLRLLGQTLARTDAQVLAWCLMSSHVHVVVIHGKEPLERLVKPVHTGFAGFISRGSRRGARGAVFAQRPRAILVDKDEYLLELVRYVHNNPVRAGLTRQASQSRWSSHRAYIGLEAAPAWLPIGFVLDQFARRPGVARRKLDAFVRERATEGRRPDLSGDPDDEVVRRTRAAFGDGWRLSDPVLGSATFVKRVARDVRKVQNALGGGAIPELTPARRGDVKVRDVVERVGQALQIEPWEFEARPKARGNVLARQLITWIWVHHLGGKQIDVARELGVGTYSVSRWYGKAVERAAELEGMAAALVGDFRRAPKRRGTRSSRVYYQVGLEE